MHPAKPMKWRMLLGALVLLALGLMVFLGLRIWQEKRAAARRQGIQALEKAAALRGQRAFNAPGNAILKDYARPGTRPEDDLSALANTFANLLLLLKSDHPFRLGANEEFAAALLGKNTSREVFLTAPHAALNDHGQLIDRWGTPLFFHVRDSTRIDIRSAGPDRKMWTDDDLQRLQEGGFHHGPDLPQEPHATTPR